MKIAVHTPTQRAGIDVTVNSILRQKFTEDVELTWILTDEIRDKRTDLYKYFKGTNIEVRHKWIDKEYGNQRNLARGYNLAIADARNLECDLLVSLQDYIYVPENGIQKFIDQYNLIEVEDGINGIYTGICSISSDPDSSVVIDITNPYSIFGESYNERPQEIEWIDVRYNAERATASLYQSGPAIEWETNWACIPKTALYDERLSFDEEFDKAVAYENQDYAFLAKSLGYSMLIDYSNQVISLPHKKYFSSSWAFEEPLTNLNRKLVEKKWPNE